MKSKKKTLLLVWLLGCFGAHRFYVGKKKSGLLYLLTFGLLFIGWFVDFYLVVMDKFKDAEGNPLENDLTTPKWAKTGVAVLAVIMVVGIIGNGISSDDTNGQTDMPPEKPEISSVKEIDKMVREALDDDRYDLSEFERCNADALTQVLIEKIQDDIPYTAEYAVVFSDYSWGQLLRLWDIAEAGALDEATNSMFAEKKQALSEVRGILPLLSSIYERYIDNYKESSDKDFSEFSDAASKLHRLESDYVRAEYRTFYVKYELEGTWQDKLGEFLSGERVIYYFANNVEDYGIWGTMAGDEQYVLVLSKAFAEAWEYELLVYPPSLVDQQTVTLQTTTGFESEAEVYYVVSEEDFDQVVSDHSLCEEYEGLIETALDEIKTNWNMEDSNNE